MMKYGIEKVKNFCIQILNGAGLSENDAEICADCLVTADMRNVHSHGITHLKDICDRIEQGTIHVNADIKINQTAESTIVVDAGHSAGMVSAMHAMKKCLELAKKSGVSVAAIHNANTYGYGAYYAMYAAEHQMIGFSVCNTKAYVAPYGGAAPMLGTNPISIAIPAGQYPNLVLDMATSKVAVNKIALAMKEGKAIPDDWAVGPHGEKTTDPSLAYQGALLPLGGYKGYGIQLVISMLAFALAGGSMDRDIPKAWADTDQECNFGCVMGAIDISKFVSPEAFQQRADELLKWIKEGTTAPGVKEILIPGERAYQAAQSARKEGIEIPDIIMEELSQLSTRYKVKKTFWNESTYGTPDTPKTV